MPCTAAGEGLVVGLAWTEGASEEVRRRWTRAVLFGLEEKEEEGSFREPLAKWHAGRLDGCILAV
jgi:hypothetical protein